MGLVTALGLSVADNLDALQAGKEVLGPPEILQTRHQSGLHLGEIKKSNAQLAQRLGIDMQGLSRTTLLGMLALKEALQELPLEQRSHKRVVFINATTVGGMSDVENVYDLMASEQTTGDFMHLIDSLDCADCTQRIARHFQLGDWQTTISTACSSAANALQLGARMIEYDEADIAICGGTDALTRFTLNGFKSLKNVDPEPCKPFDEHRNGLNLGEGAAYLVLESAASIAQRGVSPLAQLAGYGNTNEAHHPTAPSPDGSGALRTMQAALRHAGIQPETVDYINAHGTATQGNDLSEANAILQLFGADRYPPFSATKAMTGHTLAASGAVEAIICCLALKHGFIPPNLRFSTPIAGIGIRPVEATRNNLDLNYALSNSFGFGGNNVTLVIKKV